MAIAFRYVTTQVNGANTNRWVFRSFNINNISGDGTVTSIATMSTAGWQAWSFLDPATTWSISSAQIIANRSLTALNDDWIITKTFNPNKVSPDQGLAIKNISTGLTEYSAVYPAPGTYQVTFVVTNASYQKQETVVKTLTLTITP